jgi:type IX secretion system PorP/SprF family membrane protein
MLAQDMQQAQFFAMPILMNPAFAGNMEFDCKELRSAFRGSLLSRRQWGNFNSDAFNLEIYRRKSRIGFALLIQNQRISSRGFSSTAFGSAISHRLALGDNWHLASGLQLGLVRRSLAFQNFRFTDQFTDRGFTGQLTADNLSLASQSRLFPDLSAGVLAFTRRFWSGISVLHANQPIVSELSSGEERLPMKISLHAGYKIEFRSTGDFGLFRRDVSLHPVWQLRYQKPFTQMDAGFYYNHEPFVAGLLYRGFALLREDADQRVSQDAAVLLLGIKKEGFRIGYSVEVNLKRKTATSFPTQEISLSFQFSKKGCLRRRYGKWISIPSF